MPVRKKKKKKKKAYSFKLRTFMCRFQMIPWQMMGVNTELSLQRYWRRSRSQEKKKKKKKEKGGGGGKVYIPNATLSILRAQELPVPNCPYGLWT